MRGLDGKFGRNFEKPVEDNWFKIRLSVDGGVLLKEYVRRVGLVILYSEV